MLILRFLRSVFRRLLKVYW